MNNEIKREVNKRGITRLCHFTQSRNLIHIMSGGTGVLATKKLQEDGLSAFTPTDLERLDEHEGYICCSIEYPNAWYFDHVRDKDVLFKDWVILFIDPKYLWLSGTRFCPRNAASDHGRNIGEGEGAFLAMFADVVPGAYGKTRHRSDNHLACSPTDDQAEVLIPDQISLSDILEIAVSTETQAKKEFARLQLLGVSEDRLKFVIATDLFQKRTLSNLIRSGKRPKETPWVLRDDL